jgi:hypothetical protein
MFFVAVVMYFLKAFLQSSCYLDKWRDIPEQELEYGMMSRPVNIL